MSETTIRFDYHSHHWRCGHARGEMRDYIESAVVAGMVEFGVSDHGPAYFLEGDHPKPSTQMGLGELPYYFAQACALREEYRDRITVKVGVEADFVPGCEEALARLLDAHAFDYVLGSVHYSLGRNVFDRGRWAEESADAVYRDYYKQIGQAADSGLFDTLSHLTVVEAFGPPIRPALAAELYPRVADAVAASGCLVEVNTSGYRKMGGDDPFPNRKMLSLLIERGVPLTFGSDCHKPEEVGFGRDRVLATLRALGVTADPAPVQTRRGTLMAFSTGGG